MIEEIRNWVLNSRVVGGYYKAKNYIDIAWNEFSWFSHSLLEMMGVVFFLEKVGLDIQGVWVIILLILMFVICFWLGLFFKRIGTYDKSVYVDVDIDPARKEILEAARIIKDKFGKE